MNVEGKSLRNNIKVKDLIAPFRNTVTRTKKEDKEYLKKVFNLKQEEV